MRELSKECLDILDNVAQRHGINQEKALEFVIRQFRPSNQKRNVKRRRVAWRDFLKQNPTADFASFRAGCSAGWYQFQTRHNPDDAGADGDA